MKFITSRDNAFFKQLIRLAGSAQERKTAGLTLLDGIHLISAYRRALGEPKWLIVSETGWDSSEIKRLLVEEEGKTGTKAIMLPNGLFQAASPVKTPTGIMALVSVPKAEDIPVRASGREASFSVLLEAMQNPGNLGSILRSAAAAGGPAAAAGDPVRRSGDRGRVISRCGRVDHRVQRRLRGCAGAAMRALPSSRTVWGPRW